MSERTRFLARLIGLYCLLAGLLMLVQRDAMIGAVTQLVHEPSLTLLLGVLIVPAGLALVLGHNLWSGGALAVVVTVIGWLTLLKGLVFWLLPQDAVASFYLGRLHYADLYYVYCGAAFAIGLFLTIGGFRRART
ncbi:MAG: hypothetical protein ACLPTM_03290 [Steroidobacteraceae bacterium]